jgi:hypothetical protein
MTHLPLGPSDPLAAPDEHLTWYRVRAARTTPPQPKPVRIRGISVRDGFGAQQLDTIKEEELCVPSRARLP